MSDYDVRILVNGNNCRQYNHNQKVFIESKENSEYSIEIKNNTYKRILSLCSVDGLNILNGEKSLLDGPGYVINGYTSNKFEGFRVSDDKVAKFVFGKKQDSYAKSKEDGSEQNVGIIGFRIYEELINYNATWINQWGSSWKSPSTGDFIHNLPTITCNTLGRSNSNTTDGIYGCCNNSILRNKVNLSQELKSSETFDMGTKWGDAKESKVVEVGFQRGNLVFSYDIYYASRQNLIDMGVPVGNEKQVNFPVSFSKYANPPKGWKP